MDKTPIDWPYLSLLLFSLTLGLGLFFLNPQLSAAFEASEKNIEWYAIFSKNLFHPTTSYIAESIFLPFIAKVLGANASTQSYRFLCALATISLLPLLAATAQRFFNSTAKAFLLVLIFGVSFTYLSNYWLGFPDPVTIALLSFTALQRRPVALFLGALLAGLSHFSMSLFALTALALPWMAVRAISKDARYTAFKAIVLGLLASRLLLAIWFYLFEYRLMSRADIILDNGLSFFIDRYSQSPLVFWLVPGVTFLISYGLIVVYFIVQKKLLFALSLCCALGVAYLAHFLTVDGLRVFAVVISAAYVFMIAACIDAADPWLNLQIKKCTTYLANASQVFQAQALYFGIGFPILAAWLFFIGRAANKGLFINGIQFVHIRVFDMRLLDYALVISSLVILSTMIVPRLRSSVRVVVLAKLLFLAPLVIIGAQFIRQVLAPNLELALWLKVTVSIGAFGCAAVGASIKFGGMMDHLNQKLRAEGHPAINS